MSTPDEMLAKLANVPQYNLVPPWERPISFDVDMAELLTKYSPFSKGNVHIYVPQYKFYSRIAKKIIIPGDVIFCFWQGSETEVVVYNVDAEKITSSSIPITTDQFDKDITELKQLYFVKTLIS